MKNSEPYQLIFEYESQSRTLVLVHKEVLSQINYNPWRKLNKTVKIRKIIVISNTQITFNRRIDCLPVNNKLISSKGNPLQVFFNLNDLLFRCIAALPAGRQTTPTSS